MAQHFWEQLTCKPPKQKQGFGALPTSKTPGPAGWAGSGLCRQGRRHGREASAGQEKKIEIKLKPDGDSLHRTVADKKHGKYALTKCRVLASSRDFSWIEAKPVTGRTHQIRIHLKEEGFPIVCDSLYGNREGIYLSKLKKNWRGDIFEERPLLSRLGLHALKISLKDPETGEKKTFTAPFPKDLEALRKQLEKVRGLDPVLP